MHIGSVTLSPRTSLFWACTLVLLSSLIAHGADEDLYKSINNLGGNPRAKKQALEKLGLSRDPHVLPLLDDFSKDNLFMFKDKVYLCLDQPQKGEPKDKAVTLSDVLTRKPIEGNKIPFNKLEEISPGPRDRGLIRDIQTYLALFDSSPEKRHQSAVRCGDATVDGNPFLYSNGMLVLDELVKKESDKRVKLAMEESLLILVITSTDKPVVAKLEASRKLGDLASSRSLGRIKELLPKEPDPTLKKMYEGTIARIESWQSVTRGIGHTFSGLSLGSILILMALGLSIIFGLMGVINMAHGELMMIGAYATFLTQKAFEMWMPASAFDWYFVAAIPLSFLAAAIVGFLIEWLVVRHLYGRPLDTMLATFGVSWILIQVVRLQFGDNIAVNSPSWLQGGYEVMPDVVLPYNRCFIIGFCALCIGLMYFIMEKTKLGLLLRATTQNRGMAASLGVHTRRIDGYTFALGAGLAGMAGCALTQIGGVTPDMGQNYIVDSFMVVVTGGVGKLAGAIWAGMGLGCLNKFFEPFFAAVWGKVLILIFVVVFLQWRPSGLFPAKGRLADA